jgi:hypothetical protein
VRPSSPLTDDEARQIDAVLARCCAKDRDARLPTCDELRRALAAFWPSPGARAAAPGALPSYRPIGSSLITAEAAAATVAATVMAPPMQPSPTPPTVAQFTAPPAPYASGPRRDEARERGAAGPVASGREVPVGWVALSVVGLCGLGAAGWYGLDEGHRPRGGRSVAAAGGAPNALVAPTSPPPGAGGAKSGASGAGGRAAGSAPRACKADGECAGGKVLPGATPRCRQGACGFDCAPGTFDCGDGCFALTTDPRHCGACAGPGSDCSREPMPPGARPTCEAGRCGFACPAGGERCGKSCCSAGQACDDGRCLSR